MVSNLVSRIPSIRLGFGEVERSANFCKKTQNVAQQKARIYNAKTAIIVQEARNYNVKNNYDFPTKGKRLNIETEPD